MRWSIVGLLAAMGTLAGTAVAAACGCFSSPAPPPGEVSDNYAVNQQAEQIIFEVDEEAEQVTAHVLIQYEGDAASFAWILPVPNAPELGLSEELAFAILDDLVGPSISSAVADVCPDQEWVCTSHSACPAPRDPSFRGGADASADSGAADASASPAPGGPVDIISREVIGSYDTIVFGAGDTAAAITWLQSEGFIVNDTMAPFMQPYADAGMLFVAAKLIPSADVSEIKPLRITYAGTTPMIPLKLTAVGTAPELTVTAYIYADTLHAPIDQPITEIDRDAISSDLLDRVNYPMVLSRIIDEAGGDAFVIDYAGVPPRVDLSRAAGCCGAGDSCRIGGDSRCQCPLDDWDAIDCEGVAPGFQLVERLAAEHATLTRLTTRVSAHEMTFDPMFAPSDTMEPQSRTVLSATRNSLDACLDQIVNDIGASIEAATRTRQGCASVYCGAGECRVADGRAGCACDEGFAARVFTDLDGVPSVTCVPDTPPVDLGAGGAMLRSSCETFDCGTDGTCVDLKGFPACVCAGLAIGVVEAGAVPGCILGPEPADIPDPDSGGRDYSAPLQDIAVCSPAPPTCRPNQWLERRSFVARRGVECEGNQPTDAQLTIPPAPDCRTGGFLRHDGCGCSSGGAGSGLPVLMVALLMLRRRR